MNSAQTNLQVLQIDSNQQLDLVRSALDHIPALRDAVSMRIQRIIFHFYPNPAGFDLIQNWLAKSGQFDQGAAFRIWQSMAEANQWRAFPREWLTLEALFAEARSHGWSFDSKNTQSAKQLYETRLQARLEMIRHLEESKVGWLQTDIDNAQRNEPPRSHPALKTLGLRPGSIELQFLGRDPASGDLIVPYGNGAQWFAAQSINPLKTEWLKYSLMENQAHWHPLGVPHPSGEIIIADGIFNGIALYKSTGVATAVGVGAKNIGLIAREIRLNFPQVEITICPERKITGTKSKYFSQIESAACDVEAFVAYPWWSKAESYRTFLDVYASIGSRGVDDNVYLAKEGFPAAKAQGCEVRHG